VLPNLRVYLTLSARLTTAAGAPLAGEKVAFSAAGGPVSAATTDKNGTAGCSGLLMGVLRSVLGLGYRASFAGDGVLQPSSAKGPLLILAGVKIDG
jgi:hypothetical protein